MKLSPSFSQIPSFKALQNNDSPSGLKAKLASGADFFGDGFTLFATDVVDLGSSITNVGGGLQGTAGTALKAASLVMGGYHAGKALRHLSRAAHTAQNGCEPWAAPAGYHLAMMTGEFLSATGQFCAATGVGPVSLGFLGLGMLLTHAAQFERPSME